MSGIKTIEGGVNPEAGVKVGVISSRFNSFIVDHLEKGCLETLRRHGLPEAAVTIARVPGAFEIPVVAQRRFTEYGPRGNVFESQMFQVQGGFRGEIVTGPTTIVYQVPALEAGAYAFVCTVHPNMVGTLTVQ